MKWNTSFVINGRTISQNHPTYFIADIGANHDGSLERAKDLIKRAKNAGADCAKFQHFKADKIVSAEGFKGVKIAHQATWEQPVDQIYEKYSINRDWNQMLADTAREVGIHFMTTPYDLEAMHGVGDLVPAFKIGSGDITHLPFIAQVALWGHPIFLATGASTMDEVVEAVDTVLAVNPDLCLMQCNTNYTSNVENFRYVNLKVLSVFAGCYPGLPTGLSDHTPGCVAPLGAVALGARVIEKHFTDDPTRHGPDHQFALSPTDWKAMVQATRQLEMALGDGIKRVEKNEEDSRIVQRRALRFTRDMAQGETIVEASIEALRPCPVHALTPADSLMVIGRALAFSVKKGDALYAEHLA